MVKTLLFFVFIYSANLRYFFIIHILLELHIQAVVIRTAQVVAAVRTAQVMAAQVVHTLVVVVFGRTEVGRRILVETGRIVQPIVGRSRGIVAVGILGAVIVNHRLQGTLRSLEATGHIIGANRTVVELLGSLVELDNRFEVEHKLAILHIEVHQDIQVKHLGKQVVIDYILDIPEWVVIIHIRKQVAVEGKLLEVDLDLTVERHMLEVAAHTAIMVVTTLKQDSLGVVRQQVGLLKQEVVDIEVVIQLLLGLMVDLV